MPIVLLIYFKRAHKLYIYIYIGLPRWLVVKKLPANLGDVRDTGSIPGLGRSPGRRYRNPVQYFLLGKSQGQRSLEGYGT